MLVDYSSCITSINKQLWTLQKGGRTITVYQPTPEDIPKVEEAVGKCDSHTRKHYIGPGWWKGYKRICNRPTWEFSDKIALPLIVVDNGEVVGLGHLRFKRGRDMPQKYVQKLGNIWVASYGYATVDPYQAQGYATLTYAVMEHIIKQYGASWLLGETPEGTWRRSLETSMGWEVYRRWALGDGTVRVLHGKDLRGTYDINIISGLTNARANPITFKTFNQVVAYSFGEAFKRQGLRVNYSNVGEPYKWEKLPMAENTLVIAAAAVNNLRDDPRYLRQLRKKTKGKLCMYLDSDYAGYDEYFDRIFTVVKPRKIHGKNNHKYVYAGWGADPELFKPDKSDVPTMFVDAYRKDWEDPRYKWIYEILDEVMSETTLRIHHPIHHHYSQERIYWTDMAKMFNESHYFLSTQGPAESGLPRIESATSGCLLVVPEPLYMARTMGTLEHRIWSDKAELLDILSELPDHRKCRRKALKHSWDKSVKRILEELE